MPKPPPVDPELARQDGLTHDPDTGEELDCTRCGACCQAGEGSALLTEEDLLRWKRAGRQDLIDQTTEGHFGMRAFATNESGACVHLTWPGGKSICAIYGERGEICREFAKGTWQCIQFRRDQKVGRSSLFSDICTRLLVAK